MGTASDCSIASPSAKIKGAFGVRLSNHRNFLDRTRSILCAAADVCLLWRSVGRSGGGRDMSDAAAPQNHDSGPTHACWLQLRCDYACVHAYVRLRAGAADGSGPNGSVWGSGGFSPLNPAKAYTNPRSSSPTAAMMVIVVKKLGKQRLCRTSSEAIREPRTRKGERIVRRTRRRRSPANRTSRTLS